MPSSMTRTRLGDLGNANSLGLSDQAQNFAASSRNPYSQNWNNDIWASPIGSGIKSATDSNRTHSRPAPLVRPVQSSERGGSASAGDVSEEITGSGSLLTSSDAEAEGWSRRWPSMGNISSGLGNGLASARSNHTAASPARQRTTQHTRSSSPYFTPQPSVIGTSSSSRTGTGSMLDPTSRSFNASGLFNGFGQNLSSGHDAGENSRRNSSAIQFGNFMGNGSITAYSGYNSNAPSRSGSMPPSRHGNDPIYQLGEGFGNAAHPTSADPFSQRHGQHSRTSTFSGNGNVSGNKFTNQAWQTTMGDLSASTDKLNLGRDPIDSSYSASLWDSSNQMPSPGSISSVPAANFINQRHNSISIDTGSGLSANSISSYHGQQRNQYHDRHSYSPTGSDIRKSNDSPMYYNGNTPPIPDYGRALSTNGSRASSNAYSQTILNQRLLALQQRQQQQQQQQSYQPSPAVSYRSMYNNNTYDSGTVGGQGFPGAPPQVQQYYPHGQVNGYAGNVATQRAPPRGPASEMSGSERSQLLEEFRMNKTSRKYELKDIYHHVVEFSGDQHGSRFIQQKLETANSDEKAQLFLEILPNSLQLMTDVFGNYVIQKFFEHGNQQQKKQLADKMKGHITELSLQMYGCRVVQKAFEHILVDQQALLVKEIESQVLKCVKDQNGNHVIQKAIQRIPAQHISFIINAFTNQVHQLSIHSYGCRVIQRMLENCPEPAKTNILDELHGCASNLIVDQYGNYVAQHIIEHGRESDRDKMIEIITSNLVGFATQKFASNVVEKSIQFASADQRQNIIAVIAKVRLEERGETTMQRLMRDQYGNYIIQKLIKHLRDPNVASPSEYENFVELLKPQLLGLKQFSYGKQIGQIERLITSDPPSTLTTAQPSSASSTTGHRPPQLDMSTAATPPLIIEDNQSPQSSSQPSTSHSTIDEPISEGTGEGPRKTTNPKVEVEVADDSTITANAVGTPKATDSYA